MRRPRWGRDSGDRGGESAKVGLVSDWHRPGRWLEVNSSIFRSLLVLLHPSDPVDPRFPPHPQPFLPLFPVSGFRAGAEFDQESFCLAAGLCVCVVLKYIQYEIDSLHHV